VTQAGGWRGNKGSTTERGYGWDWQKLRARILARDMHLCQPCAALGRVTVATQVDHIRPKAKGGTDDEGNLQAICEPCHAEKTTREGAEGQGRAVKPRLAFDADGFPIW
jgi:5-methylcytosine-specific restriction protein A